MFSIDEIHPLSPYRRGYNGQANAHTLRYLPLYPCTVTQRRHENSTTVKIRHQIRHITYGNNISARKRLHCLCYLATYHIKDHTGYVLTDQGKNLFDKVADGVLIGAVRIMTNEQEVFPTG